MLLPDVEITKLAHAGMIDPFISQQVREDEDGRKVISYGLSSAGYDCRLGQEFKLITKSVTGVIDPLAMDHVSYASATGDFFDVPAGGHLLGHSLERFWMPDDVLATCLGKSTYARCGLIVNVTPLEPGWEGEITIELHNTASMPVRVHAGQGICQLLFYRCAYQPNVSYRDRGGKYMGQRGVTTARL